MYRILALCFALCFSACYIQTQPVQPERPLPGYLYVMSPGCWADDVWYEPCPWNVGPRLGYYYLYDDAYYWAPRNHWRYWRYRPPPPKWRNQRPYPKWRIPKPRVRDHRQKPRVIRDHRKKQPPKRRDHR